MSILVRILLNCVGQSNRNLYLPDKFQLKTKAQNQQKQVLGFYLFSAADKYYISCIKHFIGQSSEIWYPIPNS